MEFRRGAFILRALRQAEQIVRLLAVWFCFQVFVSVAALCHDDIYTQTGYADVEGPLAGFDSGNRLLLSQLPRFAVAVATDTFDALMRSCAS